MHMHMQQAVPDWLIFVIAISMKAAAGSRQCRGSEWCWSGRPGSNRRHSAWEADVLPLNYSRPYISTTCKFTYRLLTKVLMDAVETADVPRVGKPPLDGQWIVGMAIKVSLKKYLKIGSRWQFGLLSIAR